jgi:hypothetical protein
VAKLKASDRQFWQSKICLLCNINAVSACQTGAYTLSIFVSTSQGVHGYIVCWKLTFVLALRWYACQTVTRPDPDSQSSQVRSNCSMGNMQACTLKAYNHIDAWTKSAAIGPSSPVSRPSTHRPNTEEQSMPM